MKKKSIIIIAIAVFIVIVGVILFLVTRDKGINSLVTLDVDSSIELEVKSGNVVNANVLNSEDKSYVDGVVGLSLDQAFDSIIKKVKDRNQNDTITVILGMDNPDDRVETALRGAIINNKANDNILIPEITDEAKDEARARGLTDAKAAYLLELVKDNKNLNVVNLVEKSAEELNEMKKTGKYCDSDYTLVGDSCERVIKEEKPEETKVCPEGYEDINNKCYLKSEPKQEPYCKNGLELKNGKCVGKEKIAATGKCTTGTYNSQTQKCEVLTYVSDTTKKCRESDDLLLDNGKCAQHHNPVHMNPAEVTNPSEECCCGDTYKNGWCYALPNGSYDATISCPSGTTLTTGDKGKACYKTVSNEATFSCSSGTLEGNKCIVDVSKNPDNKLSCEGELKLYKEKTCIDYNSTKEYIIGYVCEKEARLINNHCVYYEVVAAKTK